MPALVVLLGGCVRFGFGADRADQGGSPSVDSRPDASDSSDAALLDATLLDANLFDSLLQQPDSGSHLTLPDLGPTDGSGTAQPDAPWSGFVLNAFTAYWASSGSIGWVWQCSGTVPDFDRFEICVDSDLSKVRAGGGTCLGPQDSWALGDPSCLGSPWWQMAVSYGLAASTQYYARLYVRDTTGTYLGSAVATTATKAIPPAQTEVFTESLPPGAWLTELVQSGANPHSGTSGLVASLPNSKWYNLHYGGMTLTFPGLTESRLKDGYLEFYLDAPQAVQVCVTLQQSNDQAEHCTPNYFSAPDGKPGYQQIQIPLTQFISKSTNKPMTAAQLAATDKFMPGATWGKGKVYIDDIVVRY
jgi:hypothetical protein